MKIKNSTDWQTQFLRRMTAWCCRELGMPGRYLREVVFRTKSYNYSGHAYLQTRRITVSVARGDLDCLVKVTAHEVAHHVTYIDQKESGLGGKGVKIRWGGSERWTMRLESETFAKFNANRESLIAEWSVAPVEKERPSAVDKRALKAQSNLERWQRKAKLAATKIRKLKARVRYYERRQAATAAQ